MFLENHVVLQVERSTSYKKTNNNEVIRACVVGGETVFFLCPVPGTLAEPHDTIKSSQVKLACLQAAHLGRKRFCTPEKSRTTTQLWEATKSSTIQRSR